MAAESKTISRESIRKQIKETQTALEKFREQLQNVEGGVTLGYGEGNFLIPGSDRPISPVEREESEKASNALYRIQSLRDTNSLDKFLPNLDGELSTFEKMVETFQEHLSAEVGSEDNRQLGDLRRKAAETVLAMNLAELRLKIICCHVSLEEMLQQKPLPISTRLSVQDSYENTYNKYNQLIKSRTFTNYKQHLFYSPEEMLDAEWRLKPEFTKLEDRNLTTDGSLVHPDPDSFEVHVREDSIKIVQYAKEGLAQLERKRQSYANATRSLAVALADSWSRNMLRGSDSTTVTGSPLTAPAEIKSSVTGSPLTAPAEIKPSVSSDSSQKVLTVEVTPGMR